MRSKKQSAPNRPLAFLFCFLLTHTDVYAASMVTQALEPGASAQLLNGTKLFLLVEPARMGDQAAFARRYLTDPKSWNKYKSTRRAAVPFGELRLPARRALLLAVFPDDFVDARGWHHQVTVDTGDTRENLAVLCEWLTGTQFSEDKILAANNVSDRKLRSGQVLLFPAALLPMAFREATPERAPAPLTPAEDMAGLLDDADEGEATYALPEDLKYDRDGTGDYAEYRLRQGEALYSSVVVRFTDYDRDADIKEACKEIQDRSGITDVRDMKTGTLVKIPLEMLSNRYRPSGSAERQHYEAVLREAERQRGVVQSPDLGGIVVVLDPGHGGKDPGAQCARHSLYEDELAYDIVCRIKRILDEETSATTYVTLLDPDQGYRPTDQTRFTHDTDEVVLTTPRYPITDSDKAVILRWYLANSIYQKEVERGTDPRKIVFTSVHCDALFNPSMRGAMVYIPGAERRPGSPSYHKEREGYTSASYTRYAEARSHPYVTFASNERVRDEALSRNFAETLMMELGRERIKRHTAGPNVRSQINREVKGRPVSMVPGVLRCNMIPTKILVETANLTNDEDCKRLADPKWREGFARAYVNALKAHYQAHDRTARL